MLVGKKVKIILNAGDLHLKKSFKGIVVTEPIRIETYEGRQVAYEVLVLHSNGRISPHDCVTYPGSTHAFIIII